MAIFNLAVHLRTSEASKNRVLFVDSYAKTLYPPFENSTTCIAIVSQLLPYENIITLALMCRALIVAKVYVCKRLCINLYKTIL